MTDLRALLDLLEQLKRQHKAGVNETFGQLDRLFELAAAGRAELNALDAGLAPRPGLRIRVPLTLERVEVAPLRMTLPLAPAARAVLEGLPRANEA
jgi:hypothetical protein